RPRPLEANADRWRYRGNIVCGHRLEGERPDDHELASGRRRVVEPRQGAMEAVWQRACFEGLREERSRLPRRRKRPTDLIEHDCLDNASVPRLTARRGH